MSNAPHVHDWEKVITAYLSNDLVDASGNAVPFNFYVLATAAVRVDGFDGPALSAAIPRDEFNRPAGAKARTQEIMADAVRSFASGMYPAGYTAPETHQHLGTALALLTRQNVTDDDARFTGMAADALALLAPG